MKRSWIKLYIEILDDPKMGRLADHIWRRAVEIFMLAGEHDQDGFLPPVEDMAWRLRTNVEEIEQTLMALGGIVEQTSQGWLVSKFKDRQFSESYDRVKRYRNAKSNASGNAEETEKESSSTSTSTSTSDSLEEEGMGGETSQKLFMDAFGNFYGKRETSRWLAICESVGPARTEELIDWAIRREIHLTNRGGLLDSLETAAKNWKEKSNGKQAKPTATVADRWLAHKQQELQNGRS